MVKCPNCGSTAQVKIDKQYWSTFSNSEWIYAYCGCGCSFHIEKTPCGIINGSFQVRANNEKQN